MKRNKAQKKMTESEQEAQRRASKRKALHPHAAGKGVIRQPTERRSHQDRNAKEVEEALQELEEKEGDWALSR